MKSNGKFIRGVESTITPENVVDYRKDQINTKGSLIVIFEKTNFLTQQPSDMIKVTYLLVLK